MKQRRVEFTQEPHCCLMQSEGEPLFSLQLMDGGGGDYLVIHAAHWAVDNDEEIDALAAAMKAMLATAKEDK